MRSLQFVKMLVVKLSHSGLIILTANGRHRHLSCGFHTCIRFCSGLSLFCPSVRSFAGRRSALYAWACVCLCENTQMKLLSKPQLIIFSFYKYVGHTQGVNAVLDGWYNDGVSLCRCIFVKKKKKKMIGDIRCSTTRVIHTVKQNVRHCSTNVDGGI